eukprot:jgi/Chrzof1/6763/Cz19g08140.t1
MLPAYSHTLLLLVFGLARCLTAGALDLDASSGFTIDFSVHQGLIAKCPNFHRDERKMCNNVQPYVLYGDPEFGCQRYYWCTPDKGICMQECEQSGTVFNQDCQCCQRGYSDIDLTVVGIDLKTCTGKQPAGGNAQHKASAVSNG